MNALALLSFITLPLAAEPPVMPALTEAGVQAGQAVEGIAQQAADLKKAVEAKELFAIKEVKGKKLMLIRGEQLGKLYLFAATIDKGTGERGMFGASQAHTFPFYFRFVDGTKVQLMAKQTAHRAAPGSPEERAINESYPDQLIAQAPAVSSDSVTGSVTIDAASLFMQDFLQVSKMLQGAYKKPMKHMEKESHLEKLASFPKNLEVRVALQFMGIDPPGIPDGVARPVTMHYSLTHLPSSEGFEPRRADPRVGYFQTSYQDLSAPSLKERMVPQAHLIHRWNLEKADPAAPVSDVKKPIVYWLDATIPLEHRDAVRAGLLAWNAAFEAVGFRNAIVVKEVDKDMPAEERASFDPANVAYNVVRWFMGDRTTMGVGPSRVNPYTGEIFNGSIRLGDQLTRLTGHLSAIAAPQPSGYHEHHAGCAHWQAVEQAASALTLAEAQGPLPEGERRRFLNELLTQLTAHEMGHNLGLRHNFAAGALHPLSEVGKDGLVYSSFMHYTPPNLGADGRSREVYYQQKVGPYDRWAIEYGYKPLDGEKTAALQAIAARSAADPKLAYCTDEDAVGSGGLDPKCQRFVLGRDVTAFARQRADLAAEAMKRLAASRPAGVDDPARLRETFGAIMGVHDSAASLVLPAIGGVRVNRGAPGDGRKPIEAVPADEQRAALKYLDERVFSSEPYRVSPQLLQSLGTDRLATRYEPSRPFPHAAFVLEIQKDALNHVFDSGTLRRLSDPSLSGPRMVSAPEVLTSVRRSVWKEIEGERSGSVDHLRRALQREHLARLVKLVESRDDFAVGDARAQARRDLAAIAANARRVAADSSVDSTTRAHLEDVRRLAEDALRPGASRPVGR